MGIAEQYTDPYERQKADQYGGKPQSGVGSVVGPLLKNVAVFWIAQQALKILLPAAGKVLGGIGREVGAFKLGGTPISERFVPAANYIKQLRTTFSPENMTRTFGKGEGDQLFKWKTDVEKSHTDWVKNWDRRRDELKSFRGSPDYFFKSLEQNSKAYLSYSRDRISSFWTSGHLSQRLAGKFLTAGPKYMENMAEFYFIDQSLQLFHKQPRGEKQPSLLNIPKQFQNYFKYSMEMLPIQLLIDSVGPVWGLAREGLVSAGSSIFNKLKFSKYAPKIIKPVDEFVGKLIATAEGLHEGYGSYKKLIKKRSDYVDKDFIRKNIGEARSAFLKKYNDKIRDFKDRRENPFYEITNLIKTVYGSEHIQGLPVRSKQKLRDKKSDVSKEYIRSKVDIIKEGMLWPYKDTHKSYWLRMFSAKKGIADNADLLNKLQSEIGGLNLGDKFLSEKRQILSEVKKLAKSGMPVLGKNFTNIGGDIVSTHNINPFTIGKRIWNYAEEHGPTIFGVNPLTALHVDTWLDPKATSFEYLKGDKDIIGINALNTERNKAFTSGLPTTGNKGYGYNVSESGELIFGESGGLKLGGQVFVGIQPKKGQMSYLRVYKNPYFNNTGTASGPRSLLSDVFKNMMGLLSTRYSNNSENFIRRVESLSTQDAIESLSKRPGVAKVINFLHADNLVKKIGSDWTPKNIINFWDLRGAIGNVHRVGEIAQGVFQKFHQPSTDIQVSPYFFRDMMGRGRRGGLSFSEQKSLLTTADTILATSNREFSEILKDNYTLSRNLYGKELPGTLEEMNVELKRLHDFSATAAKGNLIAQEYKRTGLEHIYQGIHTTHDLSLFSSPAGRANEKLSGREQLMELLLTEKFLQNGEKDFVKTFNDSVKTQVRTGVLSEDEAVHAQLWGVEKIFRNKTEGYGAIGIESQTKLEPITTDAIRFLKDYIEPISKAGIKNINPWTPVFDPGNISGTSLIDTSPSHLSLTPYVNSALTFNFKGKNVNTSAVDTISSAFAMRFQRLSSFVLGLDITKYKTGLNYLVGGVLKNRMMPAVVGLWGLDKINTFGFDMNPLLSGSSLDEGVDVFAAEKTIQARVGLAKAYDVLGITESAKYTEGLFPGLIDSPLMRGVRGALLPLIGGAKIGMSAGGPAGGLLGISVGLTLAGLQGFGTFDLTKSAAELKDIYSGREEVPVKSGRWWPISSTPFSGTRIKYFRPHGFARLKSKYRETPETYGSPLEQFLFAPIPVFGFNPLEMIFDSGHYEKRKMYSFPYPARSIPFEDVPIAGTILSAAVSPIWGGGKGYRNVDVENAIQGSSGGSGFGISQGGGGWAETASSSSLKFQPVSANSYGQMLDQSIYGVTEMIGLHGFIGQTLSEKLLGFQQPFDSQLVMANSGEMFSARRQYWDLNLGDPTGLGEIPRRFLPRQRNLNLYNPLTNAVPNWMPDEWKVGSSLAKIPEAEFLLSGEGYQSAHDVSIDFPYSAELLGLPPSEVARVMTGLYQRNGSKFSKNSLSRDNLSIKIMANMYDPRNNISGSSSSVISSGPGKMTEIIKNIEDMGQYSGVTNTDISETNFYLRQTGSPAGLLTYMYQGKPISSTPVKYSRERYEYDIEAVQKGRSIAKEMLDRGVGFSGEGYSYIDRLDILANTSPYSEEFHQVEGIVKKQIEHGADLQDRLDKIQRKRAAIMRSGDTYSYRFNIGKILTPDTTYNNTSMNTNIKAAADYTFTERMMASGWEMFAHSSNPISAKFMNIRSPLEAYQRDMIYGRQMKMWNHPLSHWADAYSRGFLSKTNPISGAVAGATAGTIAGGAGLGTFLGGVGGGIYGTVHGIYRSVTNTTYIPESIEKIRNTNEFFDVLKYTKNKMLYNETQNPEYELEAQNTMVGLTPDDLTAKGFSNFFRASGSQERPYLMQFLQEKDETERARILNYVPKNVGAILRAKWGKMDGVQVYVNRSADVTLPDQNWQGYNADVNLEDVKLKVVERQGADAHDYGLGFKDQQFRVQNQPWLKNIAISMGSNAETNRQTVLQSDNTDLRRQIEELVRSMRADIKSVSVTPAMRNTVTIINTD